jgi:hypothetical protein
VITPAYVDKVFAALNHVNGNAVRDLLAADRVTNQVKQDLRAVYNDPLYAQEVVIAGQTLQGNLSNIRRPPGDRRTIAIDVLGISRSCIFAKTETSFANVIVKQGAPGGSEYFKLTPTQAGADPRQLNPTPWSMAFNASYVAPTRIPNQCAS